LLAVAFLATPNVARPQVFQLGEMNKLEFQALDRDRTAVLMPIGVIEEHGPYLPLLSDSYSSEWVVDRIADAIVARHDWTVVIMPSLPIGVGAPEDFGPRTRDFGSLPLRPATKRAVLMDLVSGLGEAGFRWIFAVDGHGPLSNKRVTDEASDYFEDVYGGTMLNLVGVIHPDPPAKVHPLSDLEQNEDRLAVHAGLSETSRMIYVRPDLIDSGYKKAVPVTANDWADYEVLPNDKNWPGYFGSPRLARADIGADRMEARAHNAADLALRIIDGLDHHELLRRAEIDNVALRRLEGLISDHAARIEKQQQDWMLANGVQ
jgi:creatinine amidohydrolase/Fe(II)-dependent formamide hydrolase-like protein